MPPTIEARTDNTPLAVVVILLTVLSLSLGDALIKLTSTSFVLWQIFVLRSIIAIPVLLVIIHHQGASLSVIPKTVGWTLLRSLMLTVMWVSYYASLPKLDLSIAAAAYYTLPIFITLFSALFTGERVGRVGWIAIALGFIGVLLILKPAAGDVNVYALLPLLSAILFALSMILTRTKCRGENPLVLSLTLNLSFITVGLMATALILVFGDAMPVNGTSAFLFGSWTPMDPKAWMAMALLAVSILIGSIGAAIAYQRGPSSIIATFDFAYVGFATLWGFFFFNEIPDPLALAGMITIVGAGILSVRRTNAGA